MAIIGMHALIYSRKADEARRVLKDVFGWRAVDAGGGWLIFAAPPTELAVHPTDEAPFHERFARRGRTSQPTGRRGSRRDLRV
jgi:hypothetical protein